MLVTRKQHFKDAAMFWTATGTVMLFFGMKWVWLGFSQTTAALFLLTVILLGIVKGQFAIGKAAQKAIVRIHTLPEKSPFWQVFGSKQWLLLLLMMGLGMVIRFSGVSKSYRGLVLTLIGTALLWASRFFWKKSAE